MTQEYETSEQKLKVGDVVYLRKKTPFTPSKSNPTMGTMFECSGVVIDADTLFGHVRVEWTNDKTNIYTHSDLIMAEHKEYNSIW